MVVNAENQIKFREGGDGGGGAFESDMFAMLEALGVHLKIVHRENGNIKTQLLTPVKLLATDMKRKVIQSIILPKLSNSYAFQYYKVSPRTAFSHSHVGAAFLAKLDSTGKKCQEKPSFVFCGVCKEFLHAKKVEDFCNDKDLTDAENIKQLFTVLDKEAKAEVNPKQAGQDFRSGLGSSLLYKFFLHIFGASGAVAENKRSGSKDLRQLRPVQKIPRHQADQGARVRGPVHRRGTTRSTPLLW